MTENFTNQPESRISLKPEQNISDTLLVFLLEKVIGQLPNSSIYENLYKIEDKISTLSTIINQSTTSIHHQLDEIKDNVLRLEKTPNSLLDEQLSQWQEKLENLEKQLDEQLKKQKNEFNEQLRKKEDEFNEKLEQKENEFNERFKQQKNEFNEKFNRQENELDELREKMDELSVVNEAILYKNNETLSKHTRRKSHTNHHALDPELESNSGKYSNLNGDSESLETKPSQAELSVEDYPLRVGDVAKKWNYTQAGVCLHLRKTGRFKPRDSNVEYEGIKPEEGGQGKKWKLRLVKKDSKPR